GPGAAACRAHAADPQRRRGRSGAMMVGGIEIRVDGRPLDNALAARVLEVRVETHLQLPDLAVVRIADPSLEHVDDDPLPIGSRLEVLFSAPEAETLTRVFAGTVTA